MAEWVPPAPTEAPPEAKNTLIRDHGLSPDTVERLAAAFALLDKDQDGVLSEADLCTFYRDEDYDYSFALKTLINYDKERAKVLKVEAQAGTKVDFLTFALACHMHMNKQWKPAMTYAKERLTDALGNGLAASRSEEFRQRMKDWCQVDLTPAEAQRLLATMDKSPSDHEEHKEHQNPQKDPTTTTTTTNPAAEKYFKMLAVGVPRPAVELKIKRDGLNPAEVLPAEP